jgi:predicted phosphodiesterase
MRIAILADIHGNVLALEAVLADLKHRKVDQFVNLGDCVSGPLWPRETAELLRQLNWPTVRGNHDRWVTDWSPENHYPSDAFAFQALDSSQRAWLQALPPTRDLGNGVFACHGRPDDDNAYLLENVERVAGQHRTPKGEIVDYFNRSCNKNFGRRRYHCRHLTAPAQDLSRNPTYSSVRIHQPKLVTKIVFLNQFVRRSRAVRPPTIL